MKTPQAEIINTPVKAKVISSLPNTVYTERRSILAPVSTPEAGLESYDLKPLISYFEEIPFLQLYSLHISPHLAIEHGLILLNGASYKKSDFPLWSKLVTANLAVNTNAQTFSTLDFVKQFIRFNLHDIGVETEESLPDLIGHINFLTLSKGSIEGFGVFKKQDGASRPDVHSGTTSTQSSAALSFTASSINETYGRRNEVAPNHINVLPYGYIGSFNSTMPAPQVYHILNEYGMALDHTITLRGDIGFNAKYMKKI